MPETKDSRAKADSQATAAIAVAQLTAAQLKTAAAQAKTQTHNQSRHRGFYILCVFFVHFLLKNFSCCFKVYLRKRFYNIINSRERKIAMKKIIGVVTLVSLVAALGSGCANAKNDNAKSDTIKVMYDGKTIEFDVQPEIIDDRVMVPMRTIFETFGAKVKWDGDSQTITAKKKSKTIEMTIGSEDMTKNDETYSFDTAPVIEDGRTLVPVRAISDMLGLDVDWNSDDKTVTITTPSDEGDEEWKKNVGTINLNNLAVTGSGVSVDGSVITISEGGDFEITGTLEDGQIVVDTEDKVKLRLSGMNLTNTTGSAIYIKNADKAYITVSENTRNTLTDGETYTSGDEKEKGCITSRDNLEIKGKGSLIVNGNYNHGIYASDSLEIENGNITINAKNDGIHANDTLAVSGGSVNITAEGDGLQAEEIVDITGGSVTVTTTGTVSASSSENGGMGGFGGGRGNMQQQSTDDDSEDTSSKGIKAGWMLDISDGDVTVNSTDHAIHCSSDMNIKGGNLTLSSESKKGISAHGDLVIDDGDINITKSTEGIETKQIMTINGGNISVIASDDGFNAGGGSDMFGGMGGGQGGMDGKDMQGGKGGGQNNDMQQSDSMTPPEMPSGDMNGGQMPEMPSGDMQDGQMPSDDGGKGGGKGGGQGGGQGGPGMGSESNEISTEHHIQINGGTIYISAQGDGIDSNGSLVIDGGKVTVEGSTSGGDSALDSDGAMMINGGEVIAVGAVGMVEAPNSYSKQNVLNYTLSESADSGKKFEIKNSNGDIIVSYTPSKKYQSVIFSSDKLTTGEEYTVYVDGEQKDTFTVSDVVTNAGSTSSGGMGGGQGDANGGRGGFDGGQGGGQGDANGGRGGFDGGQGGGQDDMNGGRGGMGGRGGR
jgi:hypothetical protein